MTQRSAMTLKVAGYDGEPVGYVRESTEGRWAYAKTRTGEAFGVAPDPRLAAARLRDITEAMVA